MGSALHIHSRLCIDLLIIEYQLCIRNFLSFQNDKRPEYVKNFPIKLKEMSDFLGENPYFAGSNVYNLLKLYEIAIILKNSFLFLMNRLLISTL